MIYPLRFLMSTAKLTFSKVVPLVGGVSSSLENAEIVRGGDQEPSFRTGEF
jgi:hypothetical protein